MNKYKEGPFSKTDLGANKVSYIHTHELSVLHVYILKYIYIYLWPYTHTHTKIYMILK